MKQRGGVLSSNTPDVMARQIVSIALTGGKMERNLTPPPHFQKVCFLEMLLTGVPPNWYVLSRNYGVPFSEVKHEEKVDEKTVLALIRGRQALWLLKISFSDFIFIFGSLYLSDLSSIGDLYSVQL